MDLGSHQYVDMTPFPLTSNLSSRAVNQCLSPIVYVQFGTPEMVIKVKHQKDDETTGNWEPEMAVPESKLLSCNERTLCRIVVTQWLSNLSREFYRRHQYFPSVMLYSQSVVFQVENIWNHKCNDV